MNYFLYPGIKNLHKGIFIQAVKGKRHNTVAWKFRELISIITDMTGYSEAEILKKGRGEFSIYRAIVAHVLRSGMNAPYTIIARLMDRDHTTIIYYCSISIKKIETDEKYKFLINLVREYL